MNKQRDFLTVAQAADEIGMDRRTLSRWIKDGRVEAEKLCSGATHPYLIRLSEVERVKNAERDA